MEDKLKLEHLVPYVPYGLKGDLVNLDYFDSQINRELFRIETGKATESDNYDITVIVGDCESGIEDFKPYLRPLSYLTKEIEVNGKKFVPMVELKTGGTNLNEVYFNDYKNCYTVIDNEEHELSFFIETKSFHKYYRGEYRTNINQYLLFQQLLEWKFDVFGLIEKGLAIAVTEEFNPYK